MNTTIFRQLFAGLNERTKMVAIAVSAFASGYLLTGSGTNARYAPLNASGSAILDTKTGTAWRIDPNGYKQLASFSFF